MTQGKTAWEQASEWIGRTLAIVIVMVAPGVLGAWLDQRLATNFVAAIGFVFGMILAMGLLMIFTRIKPVYNDTFVSSKLKSGESAGKLLQQSAANEQPTAKPSQSRLPILPGAEILEEPRGD